MTPEVLIAGGGVGGLEAALALRALAGDRVDVTLLAPERHFTYRPLAVGEPFGHGATMQVEIARIAAERGFGVDRDAVDEVLHEQRVVITQDGCRIAYDQLVLAMGARPRVAVPGALTFRGPRDAPRIADVLRGVEVAREQTHVAFVAGSASTWTLPLYELALLTATWAAERGLDVEVSIHTAEASPLEVFGPAGSDEVQRLLAERGIAVRCGSLPEAFDDGALLEPVERRIDADFAVALPALIGPAVPGVPADANGFTPVDDLCRVAGVDDIFAVGDMTARDLKQGGLAAQQADVAAAVIAAAVGAPVMVEPYRPVLRGLLFTGGVPLYLRSPPATHELIPAGADLSSPWWPPHKIVGRHLSPYLATHGEFLERAAA